MHLTLGVIKGSCSQLSKTLLMTKLWCHKTPVVAKGPALPNSTPSFAPKSPSSFLSAELGIQAQVVHSLTLFQFYFSAAKGGRGAGEELG